MVKYEKVKVYCIFVYLHKVNMVQQKTRTTMKIYVLNANITWKKNCLKLISVKKQFFEKV